MNKSIDVFANTNPAFCSLVIACFCKGYYDEAREGVTYPLLMLPLPIILSGDLLKTFTNTSIKTGFYKWVENNPEILLGLASRIETSFEYTKPAIEYGFNKNVLILDNNNAQVYPNPQGKINNSEISFYFKNAERLGNWIGQVKSVRTIYNHLGIQL